MKVYRVIADCGDCGDGCGGVVIDEFRSEAMARYCARRLTALSNGIVYIVLPYRVV